MSVFLPLMKYRLLEAVYREPSINISELFRKSRVPVKSGYALIEGFLKLKILKEEMIGKKPTLRRLYPNLKSELGKLAFSLIEAEGTVIFFEKHPELTGPFEQFGKELADLNEVKTAVLFGSYARDGETGESDIDLLVVISDVRKVNKDELARTCRKCFVTLKAHVSARTIAESEFVRLKGKDEMLKTAIAEHVCVFNPSGMVELIGA